MNLSRVLTKCIMERKHRKTRFVLLSVRYFCNLKIDIYRINCYLRWNRLTRKCKLSMYYVYCYKYL